MQSQDEAKRLALYMRGDVRRIVDHLLKGNSEIRPRRDPNAGDYVLDEMPGVNVSVVLKELAAVGLVDEYQIASVPACPECGHSDYYIDYACPSCNQKDLERRTMIEHYACGHTDSESRFKSGNDLICPKCFRTLKLIGTDYRRLERVYHCPACKRSFSTPTVEFTCRMCEKAVLPDEARMMPIFGYRLNEKLRPEAVVHCALESPIIDALKELGYDVKAPWVEKGVSGIDHTFDIYAHKEDSEIVFGIASGSPEVGHESLFAFFARIYDSMSKSRRAILIAMPRLSREAQPLSASYGIEVVGGASVGELVQRLEELLGKADRTGLAPTSVKGDVLPPPEAQAPEVAPLGQFSNPNSPDLEGSMRSLRQRMATILGETSMGYGN